MRVPTYDSPQVAPEALPTPDVHSVASPETVGGGTINELGKAVQHATSDFADLQKQMQARDDVTKVQAAMTSLQNNYLDYKRSLDSRRGMDASGVTDEAKQWWEDNITKAAEGLTNSDQQRVFAAKAQQLRIGSLDSISTYEAGQRRQATEDATDASINTAINLAVASAGSPDVVDHQKSAIVASVRTLQHVNGWAPEKAVAYAADKLTKLHEGVIDAMLAQQNTDAAQAYYAANKSDIIGTERPRIERALHIGTLKTTAQSFADDQMGKNATEADALAAARKQFEGDQEDAAVQEIKTRFAEKNQADDQAKKDAADAAWQHFDQTHQLPPAGVLAAMDGRSRAVLEDYVRHKARGDDIVTDWPAYHDLRMEAANDPNKFVKEDLNDYRTKLAPPQMKELIDMQSVAAKTRDVASLQQQLNNMHYQMKWSSSDKDKIGQFDYAVTAEIAREEAAAKRPLSYEERQQVIDRMAIQGDTPWYHFGIGSKRYYEVYGTQDAAKFVPSIPEAERANIEAALKKHGRAVTDDAVMGLYKLYHGLK